MRSLDKSRRVLKFVAEQNGSRRVKCPLDTSSNWVVRDLIAILWRPLMIPINAHEAFYANLFSHEEIDLVTQQELLSKLSLPLCEDDCERCEGLLSLSEISAALNCMCTNKSPGPDSLSVEFYRKFWNLVGLVFLLR